MRALEYALDIQPCDDKGDGKEYYLSVNDGLLALTPRNIITSFQHFR
jgi:hypothetical protein